MPQTGEAWRILFEGFSCAERRKEPTRKEDPVGTAKTNDASPPQSLTVTPQSLTVECAFSATALRTASASRKSSK